MSGKPAARVSDPTACPASGHGTNPITTGSRDVFFDGLPAAREGDTTACCGVLTEGLSNSVFINGKRAAMVGSVGTHGNIVIGGSGTIIIGDTHTPAPFTPPLPVELGWPFDEHFVINCQETGKPLAGVEYTLKTASGKIINGVTGTDGKTQRVFSATAETVELIMEPQARLVLA